MHLRRSLPEKARSLMLRSGVHVGSVMYKCVKIFMYDYKHIYMFVCMHVYVHMQIYI